MSDRFDTLKVEQIVKRILQECDNELKIENQALYDVVDADIGKAEWLDKKGQNVYSIRKTNKHATEDPNTSETCRIIKEGDKSDMFDPYRECASKYHKNLSKKAAKQLCTISKSVGLMTNKGGEFLGTGSLIKINKTNFIVTTVKVVQKNPDRINFGKRSSKGSWNDGTGSERAQKFDFLDDDNNIWKLGALEKRGHYDCMDSDIAFYKLGDQVVKKGYPPEKLPKPLQFSDENADGHVAMIHFRGKTNILKKQSSPESVCKHVSFGELRKSSFDLPNDYFVFHACMAPEESNGALLLSIKGDTVCVVGINVFNNPYLSVLNHSENQLFFGTSKYNVGLAGKRIYEIFEDKDAMPKNIGYPAKIDFEREFSNFLFRRQIYGIRKILDISEEFELNNVLKKELTGIESIEINGDKVKVNYDCGFKNEETVKVEKAISNEVSIFVTSDNQAINKIRKFENVEEHRSKLLTNILLENQLEKK